jgi:hypothetical protein
MNKITIDDKFELLKLYINITIDWYNCKDQIKYIPIVTKFGTYTGITSFESLLNRCVCTLDYSKWIK